MSVLNVDRFGGLDVDSDPGDVGWSGAIDMCDVEIDRRGILRERDRFSSLVANTALTSPSVVGCGDDYWIASVAASVKLYLAGTLQGTAVAPCQYFNDGVQPFGTATTSYIYLADNTGANAIRRLTTAGVISAPAGMPTAQWLTRTSTDNRLVAAFTGAGGPGVWNPHRVQFSNAGDAETWGANNYVDLDPGDNEQITGAASYGNATYIFKQTKIFEFYGNSTDSSGNPVFNYRAIRNATGAIAGTAVGHDGIYFLGYAGPYLSVFRVNGGGVTEVGRPIRRILSGLAPSTFTPGSLSQNDIAFAADRFWMLATNGSTSYTLSYDPATDNWALMRLPDSTAYLTGMGTGNKNLIVAASGATAAVHKLDPTNTSTDSFRTPTGYYRFGFQTVADGAEARIRDIILQGTGTVTVKGSKDWGALDTGSSVALGTSPAIGENRYRTSYRGRNFSWQVSGTGAWSLQRAQVLVPDARLVTEAA